MTDDERVFARWQRRGTAYHESGHGLIGYLTSGYPPELLSIRPGEGYHGVTLGYRNPWPLDLDVSRLSIHRTAELRLAVNRHVAVSLAGDVCEVLAGEWWDSPYDAAAATPDTEAAERISARFARLHPRHQELLAITEAAPAGEMDADAARASSFVLTGDKAESLAHVAWMRAIVSRLRDGHVAILTTLAETLDADEVLDTAQFLDLIRKGECRCHSWEPSTVLVSTGAAINVC